MLYDSNPCLPCELGNENAGRETKSIFFPLAEPRTFDSAIQQVVRRKRGPLRWESLYDGRWSFALLRVWLGRIYSSGLEDSWLLYAWERWAQATVLVGTIAGSPYRTQFTCACCEHGGADTEQYWEREYVPGRRRDVRVFPSVDSVRAWHVRSRYEADDEDDTPNYVKAYCPRCKQVREAYGGGCWAGEMDEHTKQSMLHEESWGVQQAVVRLETKCRTRWAKVWAERAQEREDIKADNGAWLMEEEVARMRVDAENTEVTDDESANLESDGDCVLGVSY